MIPKNKEIVDFENYEEGSKQELNACYLDSCSYNKNKVINEEKKDYRAQNIIDEKLNYGNSNEIERNNEKVIKMWDGDICLNEEKRNSVSKNVGEWEGKNNVKEIKEGKQDNILPDEH